MKQLLTVALVALALGCAAEQALARSLTKAEKNAVATAIQDKLVDPDSAKFKWLDLREEQAAIEGNQKGYPYCGSVNSKNRMGGYIGYMPFVVFLVEVPGKMKAIVVSVASLIDEPGESAPESVKKMCSELGYSFE